MHVPCIFSCCCRLLCFDFVADCCCCFGRRGSPASVCVGRVPEGVAFIERGGEEKKDVKCSRERCDFHALTYTHTPHTHTHTHTHTHSLSLSLFACLLRQLPALTADVWELQSNDLPAIVVHNTSAALFYRMPQSPLVAASDAPDAPQALDEELVRGFLADVLAGKVESTNPHSFVHALAKFAPFAPCCSLLLLAAGNIALQLTRLALLTFWFQFLFYFFAFVFFWLLLLLTQLLFGLCTEYARSPPDFVWGAAGGGAGCVLHHCCLHHQCRGRAGVLGRRCC